MKRGGPRGRGNRQMLQQNHQQPQPLMSPVTHIQGLKDIDMELELLKRKRQIIEQQQQMLSSSYRSRNDYEQPMFDEPRESRYDDYTRLYDNLPPQSNSYGGGEGGPSGRKRHYVPVWENESYDSPPPKRFSTPNRGAKKAFGPRSAGHSSNPRAQYQRPADTRPAPKPYKPRPAPPPKRNDFKPTKVTKPYTAPAPKPSRYQAPAARKKAANQTVSSPAVKQAAAAPKASEEWILRTDREPTLKMNGRLELALGAIIKELKRAHPEYESVFLHPGPVRVLKKAVRDRIWSVMVGKAVTSPENIKAIYYETFHPEDDDDILIKGLESQKGANHINIISTDDPEKYFKLNMQRIMSRKLEEMVVKLEAMYTQKQHRNIYRRQSRNWIKTDAAPKTGAETSSDQPKSENDQLQIEGNQSQADGTVDSVQETSDELKTEMNNSEVKATDADDSEVKAVEINNSEVKGADADDSEIKAVEANNSKVNAVTVDDSEVEALKVQDSEVKAVDSEMKEVATDNSEAKVSASKEISDDVPEEFINNKKYQALDTLMNKKMVHLIKKFSPMILKVMDVDPMYTSLKNNILRETKKKLLKNSDQSEHQQEQPSKRPDRQFPLYYVKVLGRPGLPKRRLMQEFFEPFGPKSIKKHKSVHNLLFVGFSEKESFDKILAASGTVIGRYTLDIRISERNDNKNKNPNNSVGSIDFTADADVSINTDENKLNKSGADIIGTELDEQISDLLTSIRKVEEDDTTSDDVVVVTDLTSDENNKESEVKPDDVETVNDQENQNDVAVTTDQGNGNVVEIKDNEDDHDVVEIKDIPQDAKAENGDAEKQDSVGELKTPAKGTPVRASARLGTPGGIRTRRMSKLNE